MKRLIAICLLPLALRAEPIAAQMRAPADRPDARDLLGDVILALPDIPLRITADLIARGRDGEPDKRKGVEMLLDWQADPPTARYTLRDAFGGPQSHLAISWDQRRKPVYRYFEGYPLRAAPLPNLAEPIPGTDISWMDLSLSFLWWPGARTVGRQDVRGQSCWVVDIPAPDTYAGCAGVRLWISPRIIILLKAEAYDANNQPMRRLDVKSFKRVNNRWVIKDIELTALPARTRTVLRVRSVEDRARRNYLREDDAPRESDPEREYEPSDNAADAGEEFEPVVPVPVDLSPETSTPNEESNPPPADASNQRNAITNIAATARATPR
jgi:hypothetical protein